MKCLNVITVIGAINLDINIRVGEIVAPGKQAFIKEITRSPGGKGGNVATAVARLSGSCNLISCVGDDEIGAEQLRLLRKEGIDIEGVKISHTHETGQAYILIDDTGQNQINSYRGANSDLDQAHIRSPPVDRILQGTDFLIMMDPPLDLVKAMSGLRATKIFAPGTWATTEPRKVAEIASIADYLLLNQFEIAGLEDYLNVKRTVIVITRGSDGFKYIDSSGTVDIKGVDLSRKGYKIINTVGAGDSFIGGFVSFLALGRSPIEAAKMGNYCGAFKVTKADSRGSPTMQELLSFIKEIG